MDQKLSTKNNKINHRKTLKKIQQELNARWGELHKTQCSAQLFSSLKKQGIDEATQKIEEWLS